MVTTLLDDFLANVASLRESRPDLSQDLCSLVALLQTGPKTQGRLCSLFSATATEITMLINQLSQYGFTVQSVCVGGILSYSLAQAESG